MGHQSTSSATNNHHIRKSTVKSKTKHYLSNAELLAEIEKSQNQGKVTDTLMLMLMKMNKHVINTTSWLIYSYTDDMQSNAYIPLINAVMKYDLTRKTSAFSYFTTTITRAYIYVMNHEKAHRNIRDDILIEHGMEPSDTYIDYLESNESNRLLAIREKEDGRLHVKNTTDTTDGDIAVNYVLAICGK